MSSQDFYLKIFASSGGGESTDDEIEDFDERMEENEEKEEKRRNLVVGSWSSIEIIPGIIQVNPLSSLPLPPLTASHSSRQTPWDLIIFPLPIPYSVPSSLSLFLFPFPFPLPFHLPFPLHLPLYFPSLPYLFLYLFTSLFSSLFPFLPLSFPPSSPLLFHFPPSSPLPSFLPFPFLSTSLFSLLGIILNTRKRKDFRKLIFNKVILFLIKKSTHDVGNLTIPLNDDFLHLN